MEPETNVEASVETQEPAKELKHAPVRIDSSRPLAGQASKFASLMPDEKPDDDSGEEKVDEAAEKKIPKKEPDAGVENAEEIEEAPEEVELEDIPEETPLEPLPEWQKYIIDRLPNIQVIGHQGEDGKDRVFNVKRLEELPDDFEFSSKRAELAFSAALAAQEVNARDLLTEYKQQEAQRTQRDFEALEAIDVQNDVTSLQKAGVLPKFKYPVNDPRYDDDPAVQEANKIYNFYQKINQDYFNKYNGSGRMYRVSYEDAAYRYYALNPKEASAEVKKAIEKEEAKPKSESQANREKVASKIGAPSGANTDSAPRPLPRGTSINQIYQMYKRGNI